MVLGFVLQGLVLKAVANFKLAYLEVFFKQGRGDPSPGARNKNLLYFLIQGNIIKNGIFLRLSARKFIVQEKLDVKSEKKRFEP